MNERVIKVLNSENDFLNTVKGTIPNNITVNSVDSLTENDINLNTCFVEGYYLLINTKLIKLVHKYTKVNSGFVYNTNVLVIDVLFTWKLLPFDCDSYKTKNSDIFNTYTEGIFDVKGKLPFNTDSESEILTERNWIMNPTYVKPKIGVKKLTHNSESSSEVVSDKKGNETNSELKIDCETNIKIDKCKNENLPQIKELAISNSDNKIQIKELQLSNLPSTICIIAKRGPGKSWIVRELFNNLNKTDKFIENSLIISPTEKMNKFYGNFIPSSNISFQYDNKVLKEYLEKIEKMSREERELFSGCVVFDDCLADSKKWIKDPEICKLFLNARHYNITFIFTMQYPMSIPPDLRCNFDYVFLQFDDFHFNQKRLYEQYAGMFPTFDLFRQVFKQMTENYGSMVIKNIGGADKITDKIFHFKAKLIK